MFNLKRDFHKTLPYDVINSHTNFKPTFAEKRLKKVLLNLPLKSIPQIMFP